MCYNVSKLIFIFPLLFLFRITMTLDFAPSNRFFSWLDSAGELQGNCLLRNRNAQKRCLLVLKAVKAYNCLQVNICKFIYLNCGEWYKDMIDHRSYAHNSDSCEIKAWKKIQAWTGFEPMTPAIPVQCSTNWAIKPTDSWPLCNIVTDYTRRSWRIQARSVIVVYVLSLSKDGNILTKARKGLNFARKCNHSNTRESILSHIQTVGRYLKCRRSLNRALWLNSSCLQMWWNTVLTRVWYIISIETC